MPAADIVPRPMGFDEDTALRPVSEGVWEGAIVDGWATPRGPLGGYVMAIVVRAMELAVADPARSARSATMHFLRVPELGPVTVRAAIERQGRSLSSVSARLEQDGKLLGIALGAWSKAWPGPTLDGTPIPEVEPPAARDPMAEDFPRDQPPAFTQKLSMQHRLGDPPFSRSERGEVGGWLGLLEQRPIDAPAIAVLADAWFPAPWPRLGELVPAPTIDLTVHFRAPLPLPDGLLLGRFRNALVRDGFFEEDGELWLADGTLVAQSRQLGLLIGMAG
jgi:acyl-CoA thioesterase